MAVIFPILSTFDASGVTKAQRAFKGLNGVAKTSALAFGALGAAAGKFAFDAVKAAAQDQQAQLKLAKTLQNVTKATDAQIAANEKFITSMQFATGVNDNELRPALENLVRGTGDLAQAQDLLKLGLDVSAGSGKSLQVVSLSLTKALGGNFAGLSKLGIVIPDNIKKSKDFAQVQKHLNTLFGGQAAVAAQTFAGKLAIMRERLTEAQETIGSLLMPILTKLVDIFINNVMPAIDRVVQAIKFEGVGGGLEAIATEISNVIYNLDGTAKTVKNLILVFIGIKIVAPLVFALRASWIATAKTIEGVATTTKIATGVMKTALASTGIGLLIVAFGALAAEIINTRIEAQAMDKTISFVVSEGTVWQKYGDNIYYGVSVQLNAAALAATKLDDAAQTAALNFYKIRKQQGKSLFTPVKKPKDDSGGGSSNKAAKAAKAAAAMAKLVSDATKRATAALDKMNNKLTAAREKLAAAKEAFASFRDGVRDSINSLLNFGEAASAETGTFLQNLRAQAAGIVSFASKIQQLIKMGLSETAIQQVLAAGADAGGKIADELIKGGASAITETNALVKSVETAATALGQSGANAFYKAGVTQGQAMVNGIIAAIKKSGFRIVGGFAALPKDLQKALDSGKLSKKQVGQLNDLLSGVPKLANGGVVNKPTLAMIGEAGPEAVIPLSGKNAMTGNTYNITVNAGIGTNGTQVGREIVDAIKRYERASGPVFASA
jgi:hypothetical protein